MKFKATVYVRLRVQVDDSPGNAVRDASRRLSDLQIKKLRLGKVIDIYLEAKDKEYAIEQLDLLSDRLYANTVMEDWDFDIEEIDKFPSGVG
jgi:phosphoribosylformylglycinamidine synthase